MPATEEEVELPLPGDLPLPAVQELLKFAAERWNPGEEVVRVARSLVKPKDEGASPVRPCFRDEPEMLFAQDLSPGSDAPPAPPAPPPKRHRKLTFGSPDDEAAEPTRMRPPPPPLPPPPLPHAEAVRTCHELLYQKVAAEERARLEAKCREAARLPPVASSAPDLMSLARAYVDPLVVVVPDERVKIRPQSLEGLRAALEQCVAHPAVLLVQRLLGWAPTPLWLAPDTAPLASAAAVRCDVGRPSTLTPIWLFLDWLLPLRERLYPPGWDKVGASSSGSSGSSSSSSSSSSHGHAGGTSNGKSELPNMVAGTSTGTAGGTGGGAVAGGGARGRRVGAPSDRSDDEASEADDGFVKRMTKPLTKPPRSKRRKPPPPLPPRLMLPLTDVPKVIACYARRRMFGGSSIGVDQTGPATELLLDAAVALSDIDPRVDNRPVVDVEELLIYWMELWGAWGRVTSSR